MAVPKIAINGFGRIGRIVTRIAKMRKHFDVVAINDLTDAEHLAYAFKYDSVHGLYPGEVHLEGDILTIDNDPFKALGEKDPEKLSWGQLGVDYVTESTGRCRKISDWWMQIFARSGAGLSFSGGRPLPAISWPSESSN